jgi:predicted metal-dependent hydrolase
LSYPAKASPQLSLGFDRYVVEERISARARRIRIEVRSAGEVRLIVPRCVGRSAALAFLRSREGWIEQKIAELKSRAPGTPAEPFRLRWNGDDRFPLRGEERAVIWVPASLNSPCVRFDDPIRVFAPARLAEVPGGLEQVLSRALRRVAAADALQLLQSESAALGVSWLGPRIADQRSRWGSCTARGLISLNWRLVLAPPEVFRYVVVHELCHRIHLDHSERFWNRLAQQMPDFDTPRRWLRQHGARLHHWLPGPRGSPDPL